MIPNHQSQAFRISTKPKKKKQFPGDIYVNACNPCGSVAKNLAILQNQ